MSPFDWLQIAAGFRYCLRQMIIAVASLLACKAGPLACAESTENAE